VATRSLLSVRRNRYGRHYRLHKTPWVDPFPSIPGTEPEKRIFAALVQLGIFFTFQGQIQELKRGLYVTLAIPGYKPDFILQEYKIIIDPFSPYHHSLPGAIERDARKIGLYTALGYKVYHPWAEADGLFIYDQQGYHVWKQGRQAPLSGRYQGALAALLAIPELRRPPEFPKHLTDRQKRLKINPGYELGPFLGAGANSVAAANRKRRKPQPLTLSFGTRNNTRRRPSTY